MAAAPWADPFCPPSEGTQNIDPGVPPGSWSSLLGSALIGLGDAEEVEEVTAIVVAEAWADYLVHSGGANPPGFSSLEEAKSLLKSRAVGALLDQNTWEGIVQRLGNVAKPTAANSVQFLAHLHEYPAGVGSLACDGNDGYRLYGASGQSSLWQLGPSGSWAKLVFDEGAPEPPAGALWTHVPDGSHSYVASVPTANPRNPFGIPLARVVGELTMGSDANLHSCLVDESSVESVREQLDADVYQSVQGYANWLAVVPQTRFLALLPHFSPDCSTAPAVYTPWSNGPVVPRGTFAVSPRAAYIAGYTATASAATIDRWQRTGTEWLPGQAFAGPTFNSGFDDVVPRLAISGDGQTVAGCWISPPLPGSGFSLEDTERAGIPARFPEIFHFADGSVTYPSTGTTDSQACSHVSLDENGDTVWYAQRDLAPNWFSSPTAAANALPVLSLPGDQSAEASGPAGAVVSYTASAHDGTGTLPITCSPPSGSTFALGATAVSCSVANLAGTAQGGFQVTVRDTTAPLISAPSSPLEVEAAGPSGAQVAFSATASDIVDGSVPVSCAPAAGSVFPIGTTSVQCTSTDGHGNTASAAFAVTVTPIAIQIPAGLVAAAKDSSGRRVHFRARARDELNGRRVRVSCVPRSGSVFPLGITQVTCTASDANGTSTASFTIEVDDTKPPTISHLPARRRFSASSPAGATVDYPTPTASDNVDGTVPVDCTPPSGSTLPIGRTTVTCTATDEAGNDSSRSFVITVSAPGS